MTKNIYMNKNINCNKDGSLNLKRNRKSYSPIEISDDELDLSSEKVKKRIITDESSVPLYMNQSKYEKVSSKKLEFKSLFSVYSENHPKDTSWVIKDALIASYIIEIDWIVSELKSEIGGNLMENLLFISHDENNQGFKVSPNVDYPISRKINAYFPRMKVPFGVFHSKFMLIHFENPTNISKSFIRFVITSANFIESDWKKKSQSIWVQDFPKENTSKENRCEFKCYLIEFVQSVISDITLNKTWTEIIGRFDFNNATAKLIGSIPGHFNAQKERPKWGHLRVKSVLEEIEKKKINKVSEEYNTERLIMQFSSIGRISEKWFFEEFCFSLLKSIKNHPQIIFPTVEQVVNSFEGINGGASLPTKKMYIGKPWIRGLLHRWGNGDFDNPLDRLIPHLKTFLNYIIDNNGIPQIIWIIQGSHNLSNAAWGQLQKKTQFCIRNYELGVLIHKDMFDHLNPCCVCENGFKYPRFTWWPKDGNIDTIKNKRQLSLKISLPFSLPPKPYSTEDYPWNIELLIDS
ncbi:tyrosyl-DNA phodphodiesterase 1 (tdp1) [Cryptosporidium xiaoi]|uniref:Tyrosyl-DNA phodphodiesterase 1 (Tdp1) n=1 Tax=Cryptosporidium xiaoi TaxID=659607 RepID=A0AAV9Y2W1_9CRYT